MPLDRLIDQHRRRVRSAKRSVDILSATVDAVAELGFTKVALVQTLCFVDPGSQSICLDNFGEWRAIFIARQYYRRDPVHLAAQRTNHCFEWRKLPSIIGHGRVHWPILHEASRHGLRTGLSVPLCISHEPLGCGSLATAKDILPPPSYCRAAVWMVHEAYAEARRLHGYPAPWPDHEGQLSPRRLECLRLTALGSTDIQMAEKMNISVTTIRSHLSFLRRHYGVQTRTQLSHIAHELGLLSSNDIIHQS